MEIRIIINKEWLEKNQKKFIKDHNDQEFVEKDDLDKFLLIDYEVENSEYTINDSDQIKIMCGDDNIWLSATERPGITELLNLAQIISKYYNKAKSAIEALK